MVIRFDDHDAVTPAGNPVGTPIPVAPLVVMVISGSGVLIQEVGLEEADPTVLLGFTFNVKGGETPVAAELLTPEAVTTQLYLYLSLIHI